MLLESLTPAQREAVTHVDGPVLILAGPGSGKTRVVTHRVAYLVEQGVAPGQILALTFTNKAAEEMSARVARLLPGASVWMSTFHRFAARLLRDYAPLVGLDENFTIYDAQDSRHVLKRVLDELDLDTPHVAPERVAAAISRAKNDLVTAEEYAARPGNPTGRIVAKVYPAYQRRLLSSSAVDFDDLLLHVAQLLRNHPEIRQTLDARYRYIMVDEYQDTNRAQYVILRALSHDYPNLAATGDPDQSIYGWRGADLNNILEFEVDFPEVHIVRLERNYRSTKRILRVADALIVNNVRRKHKDLYTQNDEGAPVRMVAYRTHKEEAESIAAQIVHQVQSGRRRPRDFAVFYRINALSRALEDAFHEQGIPYQIVHGQEFYQRKEIKDVLAYAQLVNNPRDDVALERIINMPTRGIGKKTVDRLSDHAGRHGLPLLEAARQAGMIEGLSSRAAVSVARFVATIDRIGEVAHDAVEAVLGTVLSESGYREMLTDSQTEEDQNRLANIEELLTAAREFDTQHPDDGTLESFLEQVCLVNETDDWEVETDKVTLMTMHAAKGLEFPVVYIIATEEGIIPHERSQKDPLQLEEERRLLFVAMTRSAHELQLSRAVYRNFRGQRRRAIASSFLMELPRQEMEIVEAFFGTTWESGTDDYRRGDDDRSDQFGDGGFGDASIDDGAFDVDQTPLNERTARQRGGAGGRSGGRTANVSSTASTTSSADDRARITTAAALVDAANEEDPPALPSDKSRTTAGTAGRTAGTRATPAIKPVPTEVFVQGMAVVHPEHGLGKIVALSGEGDRRKATVAFVTAGERKFVLAKSPLRPAGEQRH